LLDRVAKAPADRVTVIVSDLVQSERERSAYDFIEAFRRAAVMRPEIMLLGFRSAFRGKYYVETEPKDWMHTSLPTMVRRKPPAVPMYLSSLRRTPWQFRRYG